MVEMIGACIHDLGLVALGCVLAFMVMLERQDKDVDTWTDADWDDEQEDDYR